MAKIYTKTGDEGLTSLVDGTRLSKDDLKIEAYGSVDELNAWIGVLASSNEAKTVTDFLRQIQNVLFVIGSNLACPAVEKPSYIPSINEKVIVDLETEIDGYEKNLDALTAFILPGGQTVSAQTHVARTVCRRAERQVIKLSKQEEVNPLIIRYLNRLSDYLFVLSRKVTKDTSSEEIYWKPRKK